MTKEDAKAELNAAAAAVATAVMVLQPHLGLFDRFEAERRRMENFGSVLNPSLFNSSERRAVEALLAPMFLASADLVRNYRAQVKRSAEALAKVRG